MKQTMRNAAVRHVVAEDEDTRFEFLVIPCEGLAVTGTGSGENYVYVALVNLTGRGYALSSDPSLALHWRYVAEKFGLDERSARAFSKVLADHLGREYCQERP